MTGTQYPLYFN